MRPVRLEIQGLTSYRQPVAVDFTDLDLFAITGPTGSGKSSLIDAITFALYGRVPRVGNRIKELISPGADRLKVTFYFTVGEADYRIFREVARRGAGAAPQIERRSPGSDEWRTEDPDRIRDLDRFVEDLLLLDYEAFIRSVLLPQGAFQEFLAGDRTKRREVLDRILRLAIYGVMHQRANAMRARHVGDASTIDERLRTELADATPDALEAKTAEVDRLEAEGASLALNRECLEQAVLAADRMEGARDRERRERADHEVAARKLAVAKSTLATGEETLEHLTSQLAELRQKVTDSGYDPDLRATLTEAREHALERDRLTKRITEATANLDTATRELATITKATAAAQSRVESTESIVKERADALDAVKRANAASDLRAGLKVGDPCPVCGEPISRLLEDAHADLARASSDLETARDTHKDAIAELATLERQGTKVSADISALEAGHQTLQEDLDGRTAALKGVSGDPTVPTATIAAQLNAQESARKLAADLDGQFLATTGERENHASTMATARQEAATLGATVDLNERNAAAAATEADEMATSLRTMASGQDWPQVVAALDKGSSVAPMLKANLDDARREESRVNQAIGSGRARLEQLEANIALAGRLREEEGAHRQQATLARDLASMLRTDAFPAFIRDSIMNTLAANGSAWLRKVSAGRYELRVDGQDFDVADLWNAGEERGVRTLSGGETFLASLALALALAELLPAMSGEGGPASLQSLFIDEGFSNLDEETLNVVADALEVLGQDRSRLIGVVTHLPALAERMPARIVVHKSQSGSTVTVE